MRSTSPGREPTPETSHPGAPWTSLLYLRDQPAVRAQITSNDVEAQLAEIAELLNLPRHDLINTYRVNVVLPDLPSHILVKKFVSAWWTLRFIAAGGNPTSPLFQPLIAGSLLCPNDYHDF